MYIMAQNYTIIICFVKINHLPRRITANKEKVAAGVFDSFCVAVCDLPITFSFHVSCIVQSNFESFAIEL